MFAGRIIHHGAIAIRDIDFGIDTIFMYAINLRVQFALIGIGKQALNFPGIQGLIGKLMLQGGGQQVCGIHQHAFRRLVRTL